MDERNAPGGRGFLPVMPIVLIATASGFAGLGYEIVWTRLLANSLGHEFVAVLGVLAALFAGLALGSIVLGSRIADSAYPARFYAGLELVIGLWALALIWLLPAMGSLVPALLPNDASQIRQWAVAFALPSILLLPATMAMGATLPALDAVLAPLLLSGRGVSAVYAANTFGAVLGTLATTFWIMPAVGMSQTLMLCAGINGACAMAMVSLARPGATPAPPRPVARQAGSANLLSLFVTGLLGIGFEVLAVRTASQILENTIYTFAALLAVYLLGTAVGAGLYGRLAKVRPLRWSTGWIAATVSLACSCGILMLANSDTLAVLFLQLLPHSVAGAVSAELALATAIFLLPTVGMGLLFAHLAQQSRDACGSLGPALAANTAGAALAPLLFGPLLLPLLGAKTAFIAIAIAYALVAAKAARGDMMPRLLGVAAALLLFLSPPSLRFIQVPPGGELIWHRDGVMASVSVVRNAEGENMLSVNNHFRMGGTASIQSDYREADIPLLLHPAPKRALFLGLGTGTTISAAGDYLRLVSDGVELVPEVVESFPLFAKSAPNIGHDRNIRIHLADARRYVHNTDTRYDVIVADVYHPWVDGTAALYTKEHFAEIRAILAKDGIFCQWLPLHQLDLPTLRLIIRTFRSEFPHAQAYLAQFSVRTPLIGLVGRATDMKYPGNWLDRRVQDARLRQRLTAVDLNSDTKLFGLMLGGEKDLAALAGAGPINTDDRPIVAFEAPRLAYVGGETPGDRLLTLIDKMKLTPDLVLQEGTGAQQQRLADYWHARNSYLALGIRTMHEPQPENVIASLSPKLLEVVRMSSDFDSAYGPVLAMARQLAGADPDAARQLLTNLERANPARPEARKLLTALAHVSPQ